MIHPTAVIHPNAKLGQGTRIGPYAVVDGDVEIGADCELAPHLYITGHTKIGSRNRFHAGCVIGDLPQDLRFKEAPTSVIIGDDNVFREHVTIHRSNHPDEPTIIGSHNFLMAHCHVGHNSRLGDHIVIANGALLGGHVIVEDRVFISATCMIHQFARIGTLALMQGGSGISKDLPPFTIARDNNRICGLNVVGLRRAGVSSNDRLELKQLYHLLFRSGKKFSEALTEAAARFHSANAIRLINFLESGTRGFCRDSGSDRED